MSFLGSTRCRAPRDAHTALRRTRRVCGNARRSGPEPSASSRSLRGVGELPLRHCGVANFVAREIHRGKRERFDAREELGDHFCEKLPCHAGRQWSRQTPQFVRHETEPRSHGSESASLRSSFQHPSLELHIARGTRTREALPSAFKLASSSSFTMSS